MLSYDIVVGRETQIKEISSGSLPKITQDDFIKALDENGKEVFEKVLQFANQKKLPIRWGSKGFSMNVDKDGIKVVICYGFPPDSVFKQSVYTGLVGKGGLLSKIDVSESVKEELWQEAYGTGIFQEAGQELKVVVDRKFSEKEIELLLNWLEKLVSTIISLDLK